MPSITIAPPATFPGRNSRVGRALNMSNRFIAIVRFLGFVLWTLVAMGPYLVLLAVKPQACIGYARAYFARVARICGFRVKVRGALADAGGPVLYVCNHASYLDIIVLGSVIEANFVAKAEVAGWPGFGFLARIARTVFVARKRGGAATERDALTQRLKAGDSLMLFPEGTSNDGNRVLPFKSSLFAVAELTGPDDKPLPVQPVSVAYTRLDGMPVCRALRPFYAWYGDMTLAGHLLAALGLGEVEIEVILHPPVSLADFGNRKALSNHCYDVVNQGVVKALAGRLDGPVTAAH